MCGCWWPTSCQLPLSSGVHSFHQKSNGVQIKCVGPVYTTGSTWDLDPEGLEIITQTHALFKWNCVNVIWCVIMTESFLEEYHSSSEDEAWLLVCAGSNRWVNTSYRARVLDSIGDGSQTGAFTFCAIWWPSFVMQQGGIVRWVSKKGPIMWP